MRDIVEAATTETVAEGLRGMASGVRTMRAAGSASVGMSAMTRRGQPRRVPDLRKWWTPRCAEGRAQDGVGVPVVVAMEDTPASGVARVAAPTTPGVSRRPCAWVTAPTRSQTRAVRLVVTDPTPRPR